MTQRSMNLGVSGGNLRSECRFFQRTSISLKNGSIIKREGQQKFPSKVLPFAISNDNNERTY